ncbi:MAG: hypothetical protein PVG82_04165 [Chromatiales bacterium]|jgi:hypothetical protein
MISGRQALSAIDQTLDKVRAQIDATERQVREEGDRLRAEQQAQLAQLRALAKVRLDRLDDPAIDAQLDHAERQAAALLEQREAALTALNERIAAVEQQREAYKTERQQQATSLDAAVAVVDLAEARTQARLDKDPAYREQRARAEEAERKAAHADDKAQRSQNELDAKGRAYRDDPLFMYLWRRDYGLPAYKANGLTRWLDGKVARLIGFADARANFARLSEIPRRLREHAVHLLKLADEAFLELKALDEAAQADDGIPALQDKVAEEQRLLDQIDERIAAAEAGYQGMLAERAAFALGEDAHTLEAIDYLATEFRRAEVGELRNDAYNTPYPDDDVIVSRLAEHETEQQQILGTLEDLKRLLGQHRERLQELENLRIDFKRKRYDRAGSMFSGDAILPMLLGQFLSGLLDSRMLWRVLQEHHRVRPRRSNPDFGSGGFGRGTVWRGGMGDLGDIVGKIGRGGFGGRGGGGFGGGGGFRTGGGF